MAASVDKKENAQLKARQFLAAQQADGWFPYKVGGEASLEATAWSALALRTTTQDPGTAAGKDSVASKAALYIVGSQNEDGGWSTILGAGKSDWSSGLALLSLRLLAQKADCAPSLNNNHSFSQAIKRGLTYLLESRTEFYKPVARLLLLMSQGPKSLDYARGWPWDPDCFHWIEPTSYCLMALKLPQRPRQELYQKVIDHANAFIIEHACEGGGWNHGNNITLGSQLPPYRLTTAEALLALQDVEAHDAVQAALNYLESLAQQDSSSLSLAYSILALKSYGRKADHETNLLLARQQDDGSWGIKDNSVLATALATLALDEPQNCVLKLKRENPNER